jgi:hypothetical protein
MSCKPDGANGNGCTRGAQCSSGVCAGDGQCGEPDGNPCGSRLLCRSGACGPNNVCGGCLADGDCGGPMSGRVCLPNNVCGPGCRGSGGNGCPSGQSCSSTGNGIGSCSTPDLGVVDLGGGSSDMSAAAADMSGHQLSLAGGGFSCAMTPHARPSGSALVWLGALLVILRRTRRRST